MAHFARIKNGFVDFVTVGRDDDENREDELAHDGYIYRRTSTTPVVVFTIRTVNPLRISPKPSARTTLAWVTPLIPSVMPLSLQTLCVMDTQRRVMHCGKPL
jgi:hypothetical protein